MEPTKLGELKKPKKFIRLFTLTLNCSKSIKKISNSYPKYRAIALNAKENQN